MTSRETTGLLPLKAGRLDDHDGYWGDRLFTVIFSLVQWPWLLRSLHGGSRRSKAELLDRLDLPPTALPNLGSWKADTRFLHHAVNAVEELRPEIVVELGSGASSLVLAKALKLSGGGRLFSYDQHEPFIDSMRDWLTDYGLSADFLHAPLTTRDPRWGGSWYLLSHIPDQIDLLVIDGPPWSVHPYVRGMAELLFDRLRRGGMVLLDDALRPSERIIAKRWRRNWSDIEFMLDRSGAKGTLIGRRAKTGKYT